MINWRSCGGSFGEGLQRKADRWGLWGAVGLGGLFALSFCPVSAALFFGSLFPLTMKSGNSVVMPSIYGVGTGIPVLGFALLIAFGSKALSGAFNRITRLELWARRVTGAVFILVGVYYTLNYVFEVFS